jgi:hypothetical protein
VGRDVAGEGGLEVLDPGLGGAIARQATPLLRRLDSYARQEVIVVGVRADPEPDYLVAVLDTERPVCRAGTDGVHASRRMDLLEAQTGMVTVLSEEPVRLSRLSSNLLR